MIGEVIMRGPIADIMVQVAVEDLITGPTVLTIIVEIAGLLGAQKVLLSKIM